MKNSDAIMSIIGAGSYGTALAIMLARSGHQVILWGHNPYHQTQLKIYRYHRAILPKVLFPDTLIIETNLAKTISASQDLLIAVPSYVFGNVLQRIQPHLRTDSRLIWATKGLEKNTGRLLKDVASEILGKYIPLAVISGPTFANEVAIGAPTAITLAATDRAFAIELQKLLHCNRKLRVYNNPDMIGVQLGGAVKNVIAIAAGISDGIGFGANTRATLITRGLAEMTRLGTALHANPATFTGMSGLGDLVLTCTDNQSRNRRFGVLLGKGYNIYSAKKSIGQVIEGWCNTKEIKTLAARYGVDMPISEQIYQILYCGKSITDAAEALLSRTRKEENDRS
ncbi:Glycerol-3-phosphate dehydrogenase [NAD(P)+] [Candidatus Erwinia haradaeae]|uniref:Glycerol-3-phosphate dehydrogenase [NAD(P)+] n=1 Tax=Candidatus Erwinia haradaeae TaxID=1922217 RepID=A0A451DIT8_9GAMM|nr:NAD(P)H-dependent glycerol-3-phosphate dehydrogenase [Candidatus Erwinia haradaeae]VFP86604.1 Glycerol-3-phosphate dehydrogenase [NAD(P)+] [Candidatus Erwinia haradaeae]